MTPIEQQREAIAALVSPDVLWFAVAFWSAVALIGLIASIIRARSET